MPNAIERLRNWVGFDPADPAIWEALAAVDALYQAAREATDTLRNLPNDEITVPVVFGALGPVAAAVSLVEGTSSPAETAGRVEGEA